MLKINASTKSLVERLCDFKIYAISVLSFIGSVCAPDKATLKAETDALQCTTAGPYNAIPSNLLGVGSVCGLGPDLVGIHSISLAARYRVAACSSTLRQEQDFAGPISVRASKVLGPMSRHRIADILLHKKLFFFRVLFVLGSLLVFFASSGTGCARLKDFTPRIFVLDVRTNPTLSLQRMPSFVRYVLIFLRTGYYTSMKKPSPT